jgi:hypothetical protein
MTEPLTTDDAKHLIRLCQAGRLYDVEEWIRSGRSLKAPEAIRVTPLGVALRTGFHSLIELLLRHEESQGAKNAALSYAVLERQLDVVELAVQCGADPASVPFVDVLLSWDKRISSFFIDRDADLVTGFPFAQAFRERIRTAIGCFLDCRRRRPDLAAQLQEQIDMALRQFCEEGNVKWVSLLMWAGANPRSRGPTLKTLDDPDLFTTALDEACTCGNVEVLKKLKPDPNLDDFGSLLRSASAFAYSVDIVAYLVGLRANPNDKPNGGSSALDASIQFLGWEHSDRVLYGGHHQTPAYRLPRSRQAIRVLIEHGALWRPGDSLNETRRSLYRIDPDVTIELVVLLLKHRACDEVTLRALFRTPRMQQHMKSSEQRLSRLGLTLDGGRRAAKPKPKKYLPSSYVLSRYDRERLYTEVWSEPSEKVAARYCISGVMLVKVCRQLKVPKPPPGYWAKKAAGRSVPRCPKLPALASAPPDL